jgi:hypothetical protein
VATSSEQRRRVEAQTRKLAAVSARSQVQPFAPRSTLRPPSLLVRSAVVRYVERNGHCRARASGGTRREGDRAGGRGGDADDAGRWAAPLIADEDAVRDALDWCTETCPLPGHRHGWAFLEPTRDDGELSFACDCFGKQCGPHWRSSFWRSVVDAYWSVRTGHVLWPDVHPSRTIRFALRLLLSYRCGLIEPEPVAIVLPDDVREREAYIANFFGLWWGLRRRVEPELVDVAFSARFAGEARGYSRAQAMASIRVLASPQAHNVIELTREDAPRGRFKHGTRYYRPVAA